MKSGSTKRAWSAGAILGLLAFTAGCGGGGGGNNNGFVPPPVQTGLGGNPVSNRTFTFNNWNNTDVATVVSSSVGLNEADTSSVANDNVQATARTSGGSMMRASARTAGQGRVAVSRDPSPAQQSRLHTALRGALKQRSSSHRPEFQVQAVAYDSLASVTYVDALSGNADTLQNLTPGVQGNPGTKPVHCVVFVQAGALAGNTAQVQATVQSIVNAWEVSNPFNPNKSSIYDQDHALFGNEWGASVNGTVLGGGGQDGDPRVVLAILSDSASEPGLFGFFDPVDELGPAGTKPDGVTVSNGGEILYLVGSHFSGDMFEGLATMAHEFQHMISFNNKVALQGTFPQGANASDEETTINEGLSVLGEEDNGFSINAGPLSGGDPFKFDIVNDYEASPQTTPFFVFNNLTQDYGKGFLFMKNVQDHFGGTAVIHSIDTSPGIGIANLQTQTGQSFAALEQNWALTDFSSGLNNSQPQFTFSNLNMYGTFVLENNNQGLVGTTTASLLGVNFSNVANGSFTNPTGGVTVPDVLQPFVADYVGLKGDNDNNPTLSVTVDLANNVQASLVVVDANGNILSTQP